MSKSIFVVILFGNRTHSEIAEAISEALPHVRKVEMGLTVRANSGVMAFEEIGRGASKPMVFIYPGGVADDYSDVYDGERTILSLYGCHADHDIVRAITEKFGGIYEMKEQGDWMVVERRKFLHELPSLACLTLSEECQMQMAG